MQINLTPSLVARFWKRVRPSDGCWEWQGEINHNGYGILDTRNRAKTTGCVILAHRLSYVIHVGPLADDRDVLHTCDNPPCVRPDHLFEGDNEANVVDKVAKGRQQRGEQVWRAKLTDTQIIEIRARWNVGGIRQKELAEEYGVSRGTMSEVISGKLWKHLP
jgi:hypothetical protein